MSEGTAVDPVCGKQIDVLRARAIGIFGGVTYYFCSQECKAQYRDPRRRPAEPEAQVASRPADVATPRRWRRPIFVLALAAGISSLFVWRARPTALPNVEVVRAIEKPAEIAAPRADLATAAAPVVAHATQASPVVGPADLQPPLKLGLRRFVEGSDSWAHLAPGADPDARHRQSLVVSAKLLVIDARGRSIPFEVGRLEVAGDLSEGLHAVQAIQPKPAFVASTAEPGILFEDLLEAGDQRLFLRISRLSEALVAETRGREEAPWQTRLTIPISATTAVRAAAFARGRYAAEHAAQD